MTDLKETLQLWTVGKATRPDVLRAVEVAIVADPEREVLEELPRGLREPVWTVLKMIYGREAGDGDVNCDNFDHPSVVPRLRTWVRRREDADAALALSLGLTLDETRRYKEMVEDPEGARLGEGDVKAGR